MSQKKCQESVKKIGSNENAPVIMRLHAQLLHLLQFIESQQLWSMVPETGLELCSGY